MIITALLHFALYLTSAAIATKHLSTPKIAAVFTIAALIALTVLFLAGLLIFHLTLIAKGISTFEYFVKQKVKAEVAPELNRSEQADFT